MRMTKSQAERCRATPLDCWDEAPAALLLALQAGSRNSTVFVACKNNRSVRGCNSVACRDPGKFWWSKAWLSLFLSLSAAMVCVGPGIWYFLGFQAWTCIYKALLGERGAHATSESPSGAPPAFAMHSACVSRVFLLVLACSRASRLHDACDEVAQLFASVSAPKVFVAAQFSPTCFASRTYRARTFMVSKPKPWTHMRRVASSLDGLRTCVRFQKLHDGRVTISMWVLHCHIAKMWSL